MDKEELKTTNLWNVTLTADESGNPLYLTFGGVRYVKEGQQNASGLVKLNEDTLYAFFREPSNQLMPQESYNNYIMRIIKLICARFGQVKEVSVEQIYKTMVDSCHEVMTPLGEEITRAQALAVHSLIYGEK